MLLWLPILDQTFETFSTAWDRNLQQALSARAVEKRAARSQGGGSSRAPEVGITIQVPDYLQSDEVAAEWTIS